MVKGVISILTAAAAEPTVKNFVLTSSSNACFLPRPNVELNINEDMWNEESVEKAYSLAETDPMKPWHIYAGHKVLVERAAWKFMKEKKPAFLMNAIMPHAIFGPILDHAQAASTAGMLKGLFEGNWAAFSGILPRKSSFTCSSIECVTNSVFYYYRMGCRCTRRGAVAYARPDLALSLDWWSPNARSMRAVQYQ